MIKRPTIALFILMLHYCLAAQPDLRYYLPASVAYDPEIPTPSSVIGHEVGEFHVTHDRLVAYMQALDQASDRIRLEITGYTHERRPLLLLTVTAPENQRTIETIRSQHVQLTDPASSASLNTSGMPVVIYIGCSIHGNEASGSNAALLVAYHLAAAQGDEVDKMLRNTVILFDPSFNPDGLQRFATWVNSRKSKLISADPHDMEHHEPWPGGRTNHYWFDLNRDWLVAQQPESAARIKQFHRWKPNVLTDHHEMGTNSTFFFQPGVPSRSHPITPARNAELTKKMGVYHAAALDKIGSLYFTQQGFDDYYYGKGSTFPDVQGAVGILFEQASARGHAQESDHGILTFPFAIRNQFITAMSSLEATNALRVELLNYQRQFFQDADEEGRKDPVKAIVFGAAGDAWRARHLAEILNRQDVSVFAVPQTLKVNGRTYEPGSGYIVPLRQAQYRLLRGMFEKRVEFQDSLFYDISSWTLPLAAGVDYDELKTLPVNGSAFSSLVPPAGKLHGEKSKYAYVFEPYEYYVPRAVYRLVKEDIRIKVAQEPFYHSSGKKFDRGSILVPLAGQEKSPQKIDSIITKVMREDGIDVHAFHTGLDYTGSSLGSNSFRTLDKPEIAMLVEGGVSAGDAGEMWHLMDQRFDIPVTMMPVGVFNTASLNRYTVIIFPPGSYGTITDTAREKLKTWIRDGGVVIGLENAINWFQAAGLGNFVLKQDPEKKDGIEERPRSYADIENYRGAQQTSGAIFQARADLTHPLLYGYGKAELPLFKGNNLFLERAKNAYANPLVYTAAPLVSGYVSKENLEKIRNTSVAGVSVLGKGRVIGFTENLAFRGFWFGTNRMLLNAIFYGPLIDAASGR